MYSSSLFYALFVERQLLDTFGKDPKFGVSVTCASGFTTKPDANYFRYVSLTQRVVYDGKLVCYITYRLKHPKVSVSETPFSSLEIFGPDFNRSTSMKFHIDDPSYGLTPKDRANCCLQKALTDVIRRVNSSI